MRRYLYLVIVFSRDTISWGQDQLYLVSLVEFDGSLYSFLEVEILFAIWLERIGSEEESYWSEWYLSDATIGSTGRVDLHIETPEYYKKKS